MKRNLKEFISDFGEKLENRLQPDILYHLIFWIAFFFFLVIFHKPTNSLVVKILDGLIHIAFYLIIVYVNFFYLFKKFVDNGKIAKYVASLMLLVVMIFPLKHCVFYGFDLSEHVYSTFLSCFFIASMSSIFLIFQDWYRQKSEQAFLQQQNLKSELNFLKTQINPHFLFNTLNSLYALTLKKSDDAPNIVLRLSEMMRYMLYECNEKKVDLQKEINYLKNYLELEKIRHSGKFDIDFKLSGAVTQQKISPLLFIPFVENSFKHGLNKQLNDGYVSIHLDVKNQAVNLAVENSKAPQLPSKNPKKSGGIGLQNVKKRLHLLYPERHELNISDNPNTHKINLSLQL